MLNGQLCHRATTFAGMAVVWMLCLLPVAAQENWKPLQIVEAGTTVSVRTTRTIDERTNSGRVFAGVVDQDVRDSRGRLAIPRGAAAELIVRRGRNGELYLDLESISMDGHWYG